MLIKNFEVNDAARGAVLSIFGMTLALLRNYDPFMSPTKFRLIDLLRKFGKEFGIGAPNISRKTTTGDTCRSSQQT